MLSPNSENSPVKIDTAGLLLLLLVSIYDLPLASTVLSSDCNSLYSLVDSFIYSLEL